MDTVNNAEDVLRASGNAQAGGIDLARFYMDSVNNGEDVLCSDWKQSHISVTNAIM